MTPPKFPTESYVAMAVFPGAGLDRTDVWGAVAEAPADWNDLCDSIVQHFDQRPTPDTVRVGHSVDGGMTYRDVTDAVLDVIALTAWRETDWDDDHLGWQGRRERGLRELEASL